MSLRESGRARRERTPRHCNQLFSRQSDRRVDKAKAELDEALRLCDELFEWKFDWDCEIDDLVLEFSKQRFFRFHPDTGHDAAPQ